MKKVVMAVNNPATIDYRVVKSAEMVARKGYDCHVIGILKPGFEKKETINGVTYHRVPIANGLCSLFTGLFPVIIKWTQLKNKIRRALNKRKSNKRKSNKRTIKINNCIFKVKMAALKFIVLFNFVSFFSLELVFFSLALVFFFLYSPILLLKGLKHSYSKIIFSLDVDRSGYSLIYSHRIFWKSVVDSINDTVCQFNRFTVSLKLFFGLVGKFFQYYLQRCRNYLQRCRNYLQRCRNYLQRCRNYLQRRRNYLQRRRNILLAKLKPAHNFLGVFYLQGRYLCTFYPKLLELNGDVYHAHELWTLQSCALASKKLNKRLLYDSHELEPHRNNNWGLLSNKVRISHEKRYIQDADAVFAVSDGCAKEIKKIYSLSDVHLLRNTPLLSKIKSPSIGVRKSIKLDDSVPLMIYTGLITINRGLETIISSLESLSEWHFVTVGPWNETVKSELIHLADAKGVADRFHIHEKVAPEILVEFISDADLAVIPIMNACLSYYYCMPNKIFEATFAGLPIVASDLPDMKQFIEANNIGKVFQNGDAKSLSEAVKSVSTDNRYPISMETRNILRNKYCFENEVESLLNVYCQLTA